MNWAERFERIMRSAGDDIAWWIIFMIFSATGASALGLSVLLRSGNELTKRAVLGAAMHSFCWGLVIFLMGHSTLKHDLPMLLGLSILSGLGAACLADLALLFVKLRYGINVSFNPPARKPEGGSHAKDDTPRQGG